MSVWESYPASYRQAEVEIILAATQAGDSVAVIGLSGAGKSNLLGFLARRVTAGPHFVLIDCNRVAGEQPGALLAAVGANLGQPGSTDPRPALEAWFAAHRQGLCLVLDRFDALAPTPADEERLANPLRSLRDDYKYQLSYVTGSRRPLAPHTELAELFFGHTLWLGPLSREDSLWSAGQYLQRRGRTLPGEDFEQILALSGGYPACLRAVCEAYAAGCPLTVPNLLAHPAVQARLDEFWADQPTPAALEHSRLVDIPLLQATRPPQANPANLTAKEQALLEALQARPRQIQDKDELIRAVWPEDKIFQAGVRDDSLAQLVRRLREKIEPDPAHPRFVRTVPGRGYQWLG